MLDSRQAGTISDEQARSRKELTAALTSPVAFIPSKYFYDSLGSRLFDAITRLPEYYLTRTEAGIFSRYVEDMARAAGTGTTLIDLGAGNCEKAKALFHVFRPRQYVALDISADYLGNAVDCLRHQFPDMNMMALRADLTSEFMLPRTVDREKRLFFYPGSSIGNFTPEEANWFLANIRAQCGGDGGLLIGIDLVKDKAVLDTAYDDALGVTAAFNLNILNHVNRILGSNFAVQDWRHRAFFNAEASRVEMHLEAARSVTVEWPHGSRRFQSGERIHTENSYKYRLDAFEEMLQSAGFGKVSVWTDNRRWYAVCHARA